MSNQIERLQAHFNSLNIDQKRGFIEDLQSEMRRSDDPGWREYLHPFVSRCIMEYNDEIKRMQPASATPGAGAGAWASPPPPPPTPKPESYNYCECGYKVFEGDKFCNSCGTRTGAPKATAPKAVAPKAEEPAASQSTSDYGSDYGHPTTDAGYPPANTGYPPSNSFSYTQASGSSPARKRSNIEIINTLDDIFTNITNLVPISGSTIMFVACTLMVVVFGVNFMSGSSMPVDVMIFMDTAVPMRGMSWQTFFMIESAFTYYSLLVAVMGIVCSMYPKAAGRCRILGVVLIGCRAMLSLISVIAHSGVASEFRPGFGGGSVTIGLLAWILPFVYLFAAHKIMFSED